MSKEEIFQDTYCACFKFMSKEEQFQDTYCQKCGTIGLAKYRETIYSLPLYLIIILNRGRGNIFNCNVQIPEIFDASSYIEIRSQNNNYELVGIVSHFGESGMGGHFIAFCKHSIDGKWRCYNDSIVTECQNDYLNKIVFYKKCQIGKSNMQNNNQVLKKSISYRDLNPNFYNKNMPINNNFNNNNNINQKINMINMNNNFIQQNMMMNNNNNQNIASSINNFQNINANNNFIQQNMMMNNNNNNNNQNMAMNINNFQNTNANNNLIQQNMMMNNFNNFNQNVAMNMNNQNNNFRA